MPTETSANPTESEATSAPSETEPTETVPELPEYTPGDTGGLAVPLTPEGMALTIQVGSDVKPLDSTVVSRALEQRLGIDIEWQQVPEEEWVERLRTDLEVGVMADIVAANGALTLAEINHYGDQGLWADILAHQDALPNFTATYLADNEHAWFRDAMHSPEDKLYLWPVDDYMPPVQQGMLFARDKSMAEDALPWTDQATFETYLQKMQEAYPNRTPFVSRRGNQFFADMAAQWGMNQGPYAPFHYDEEAQAWVFMAKDPRYRAMLDTLKGYVEAGLLDPNDTSFTRQLPIIEASAFYDDVRTIDQIMDQGDLTYDVGLPIGSTGKMQARLPLSLTGPLVTASEDTDKVTVAFQVLDYLLSPEGRELMTVGIEGVQMEWGEENTPIYPIIDDKFTPVTPQAFFHEYGLFIPGLTVAMDPNSVMVTPVYVDGRAQELIEMDDSNENPMENRLETIDPTPPLNAEEAVLMAEAQSELLAALWTFSADYIEGNADYDAFLEEVETTHDVTALEDALQSATERREANPS